MPVLLVSLSSTFQLRVVLKNLCFTCNGTYLDITLFVLLHLDAWLIWTTVSGFRAVLSVTACGLLLCSSLWSFSLLSPSLSPSLSSFSQQMSSSALFFVFCCRMVWRLTWFDLHVFSLVSFYMCASNLVFRFDFECCSIEIFGPLCNFARSLTDTRGSPIITISSYFCLCCGLVLLIVVDILISLHNALSYFAIYFNISSYCLWPFSEWLGYLIGWEHIGVQESSHDFSKHYEMW